MNLNVGNPRQPANRATEERVRKAQILVKTEKYIQSDEEKPWVLFWH